MNRKLTVILASDIAGYSRLIAEDEEETLRRFAIYRGVFEDLVAASRGRIFNTAGDAILAEFPSAVDALRCAIDVQESLRTRNLAYPPSRQIVFRMGMTIGDVVERDGDLLGDGVNVAARLQTLAKPGGICISKSVHEAVANKLSASYSDMGMHTVKNIPSPVHVYDVGLSGPAGAFVSGRGKTPISNIFRGPLGIFASLALAVIVGAAIAYMTGVLKPVANPVVSVAPSASPAAEQKTAEAAKPPADKPSSSPPAEQSAAPAPPPEVKATPVPDAPPQDSGQTKVATAPVAGSSEDDPAQLSRLLPMQWANCRSEDTDAAIVACRRLIAQDAVQGADLALAHERLAYSLRKQGKLDEAIDGFTKSLSIAKSSDAYNERGTAYFIKGQLDDAVTDYSSAIAQDSQNGDAFNNRAWAYFKTGRSREALADADKAIALIPNKAYAWDTRGHIEENLANRTAAIEDFKKALALDPQLETSSAGLKRLGSD